MSRDGESQVLEIKRYLLGELSENEATVIEERYFVDNAYFLMLLAVEAELNASREMKEVVRYDHEGEEIVD